ncbi:MAG: class I SAM-dependent methyltransferase [bacterium]
MNTVARESEDLLQLASSSKQIREAEQYKNLISRFSPTTQTVIEIGCSWGYLLYNLKQFGYSVQGFELSTTTSRIGSEKLGVPIFTGAFEKQETLVDVIILRHVFEHVPDSISLLKAIVDSLKKEGLFILEGPSLSSISSCIFQSHVSWVSPPDHVNFPKIHPLVCAMEKLGFETLYRTTRRGRGISVFHQMLLWGVALVMGGKENAKSHLGGVNDPSPRCGLNVLKKMALGAACSLDWLTRPVSWILSKMLMEEEMLLVFKKK